MDSDRVPEQLLVNLNPYHCCVRINSDTTCYPAFSLKTDPPPDLSHGSAEAVRAVLEASMAYTVDYAQARERMDRDVQQWLDSSGKLGGDSGVGDGDAPVPPGDAPDASESPSGVYEKANLSGATDRPNRATRRAAENRRRKESASGPGSESAASEPAVPVLAGSPAAGTRVVSTNVSTDVPGVDPEDVQASRLAPAVLKYIVQEANHDRGLRKAIDRRMGNQVSRAYRRVRAEAEAEVAPRVEAEVAKQVEALREEALVQVRREMADSMSGSGSGRSLEQLRQPGSEG